MRTEDLKRTILKMFRGHDFYSYEVKKKLAHEGIEVHLSRLYRVLNSIAHAYGYAFTPVLKIV